MLMLKLSVQASYSEPKAPSSVQNLQKAGAHTVSFLELANNLGGTCDPHLYNCDSHLMPPFYLSLTLMWSSPRAIQVPLSVQ